MLISEKQCRCCPGNHRLNSALRRGFTSLNQLAQTNKPIECDTRSAYSFKMRFAYTLTSAKPSTERRSIDCCTRLLCCAR